MRITAASPGKVNFELDIEKQHTNRLGILHGGTIASMVDASGSLAVASRGLFSTGVSTDLSVTYLNSGGKIGDMIRGEVVCDKCTFGSPWTLHRGQLTFLIVGKTLAYTSVKFINKNDEIVARGSHTKFVAIAQNDEKNIVDQLKPEVNESKVS
jgi:acyl-coenzyme A thioesterase 13